MPQGEGTYGSKVGRPAKKKKRKALKEKIKFARGSRRAMLSEGRKLKREEVKRARLDKKAKLKRIKKLVVSPKAKRVERKKVRKAAREKIKSSRRRKRSLAKTTLRTTKISRKTGTFKVPKTKYKAGK